MIAKYNKRKHALRAMCLGMALVAAGCAALVLPPARQLTCRAIGSSRAA